MQVMHSVRSPATACMHCRHLHRRCAGTCTGGVQAPAQAVCRHLHRRCAHRLCIWTQSSSTPVWVRSQKRIFGVNWTRSSFFCRPDAFRIAQPPGVKAPRETQSIEFHVCCLHVRAYELGMCYGCDGVWMWIGMLSDSDDFLQIRNLTDFQTHLDSDSAFVLESPRSSFVPVLH